MSLESVRDFLARHAPDLPIIDQGRSTATVAEAAETLGVAPGQIAKTLSVRIGAGGRADRRAGRCPARQSQDEGCLRARGRACWAMRRRRR
jgi:hypothetical protein